MNITLYPELLTPEILETLLKVSMKVDINIGINTIRLEVVNRYTVGDFTVSAVYKIGSEIKVVQISGFDNNYGATPGVTKDYVKVIDFINKLNSIKI